MSTVIKIKGYPTEIFLNQKLPKKKRWVTYGFVIFDRQLPKLSPEFARWIKSFRFTYPVTAGEKLKDLENFPTHLKKMINLCKTLPPKEMVILSVGGGSVGDFSGWTASVFKRGVELIHIPTTWLAALDSAHGGKTALNVDGVKNQVGTFYPASEVHLVEKLLKTQSPRRAHEALGEFVKVGLIDGGRWFSAPPSFKGTRSMNSLLWNFLPMAVKAKYKIILRDPMEKNGSRQILNFGHTLGHALESYHGWPHGQAIRAGLDFALRWSLKRNNLNQKTWNSLEQKMRQWDADHVPPHKPIPKDHLRRLIEGDKKSKKNHRVNFVFLKGLGKPLIAPVSIEKLLKEAQLQGWCS